MRNLPWKRDHDLVIDSTGQVVVFDTRDAETAALIVTSVNALPELIEMLQELRTFKNTDRIDAVLARIKS